MTANLFGERFLGVREPAWHKLGKVVELGTDPLEGLKLIDGDFQITKAPLTATVPTLFGDVAVQIPDKFAIIREPTSDDMEYACFGTCGNDYEIIQRTQLATALRKLSQRWPLETIGLLGKGETVFFTLDAGTSSVGGDEVKQFFLVTDKVDGRTSARIAFTPVRVVCQNTLDAGLRAAITTAVLDHRTGIGEEFEFRVDLIDRMAGKQYDIMQTFEAMASYELSAAEIQKIFADAYPDPRKPKKLPLAALEASDEPSLQRLFEQGQSAQYDYEFAINLSGRMRDGATALFQKFNDEFPQTAGTAWAAFNAIVEMADWREGRGGVDQSALFGPRAAEKHRAYASVLSVIK